MVTCKLKKKKTCFGCNYCPAPSKCEVGEGLLYSCSYMVGVDRKHSARAYTLSLQFHVSYICLVQLSGVRTCHVVGFTRGRYREHSTTRIEPDKTAR